MTRSIFALSIALALLCFLSNAQLTSAQNAPTTGVTQITGVVLDAQRRSVGDAQVRLSGPISKTTVTAGDGSFGFLNLPTGIYRLDISKAGFNTATQDSIVTTAGSTTNLSFTLQAASLTSLTIIGNVSVSAHNGANAINTTPASIVDVPATTFTDQGQLSVNQVLNEEPGLTVGAANLSAYPYGANATSPQTPGIPSIRGGLAYETESLIDGHAISLGQFGTLSPSFLSPYVLQNVEVVKGPGATSPSINYAINGTVNYRTLEPTLKPQASVDLGEDQDGGNFANLRATGTLPGDRLSYAFDYVTEGTQGIRRGFTEVNLLTQDPAYLNGVPFNAFGDFNVVTPGPNTGQLENYYVTDSVLACCPTLPMYSNQRNELGKLRYAFTPSTVLTVTWLGEQSIGTAQTLQNCPNFIFTPPAGYAGSIPAGPVSNVGLFSLSGANNIENNNLFETEFHTPLGETATLLLRQYSSSLQSFCGGPGDSGPTAAGLVSLTTSIYGGAYLNGASTPTLFNGQIETLTAYGYTAYSEIRSTDRLSGYTAEIDKQAGNDLLSLSYDEEKTSTYATSLSPGCFIVTVPSGSSQSFESVMGRVEFALGERVNGTISDNFGSYTDVYSQDGGVTFQSATHTYEAPRLSLTWRPNPNQSVRAAAGVSIAPPYIALLNNDQVVNRGGGDPVPYFTTTVNSGDILPETAFGFDLGFDTRIHSPFTVLSVDAYQTLLHDQFLESTSQQGTYTCLNPLSFAYNQTAPLYVTKTSNIGHSEYEGIEVSLHRTPPMGWGYRVQGSLMRAFVYDLPAGFYDNPPTCTNCVNLGILPNINFQQSGVGYNAMATTRVPYSMGYGEINYRGRNGAYFLAGLTYYGPNNTYNEPAFEVVTASFNQPLTKRTSLQLSIYNLTNTYPGFLVNFDNARIQSPLINGYVGGTSAQYIGPETLRLTLHIDLQ